MKRSADREGFVLISVLIVVVLLTLAAYQFSELMLSEYRAADRIQRTAQARAFAQSGIDYALAVLSDPDTFANTLSGNPFDNPTSFQGIIVAPNSNARLQGRFSLVALTDPEDAGYGGTSAYRYGLSDECAKINMNTLLQVDRSGLIATQILMKLPNMTEDLASSMLDWIDEDEELRTNGAESQSYSGRTPSYRCKNAQLDSLEELLYVRNMTTNILFGNDRNRNGKLDVGEGDSTLDRGIAPYLTIYSRELNKSDAGTPRIYLNDSDMKKMQTDLTPILGEDLTNYLILYKINGAASKSDKPSKAGTSADVTAAVTKALGGRRVRPKSLSSVLDLVNTQVRIAGENNQPDTLISSPLSGNASLRDYLPILFDQMTTQKATELPARVNINNASRTVISALPGVTETELGAILDHRPSTTGGQAIDPIYATPTWLLTEANLPATKVKAMERYITCRTQVYRVQVIGYFDQGGPTVRLEAVIDTNQGAPRVLYWRDLTELGKGMDVRGY